MKTHDLTQGSAEWHAYRATHFNASDAPAMMGCSPYKTRSELLHELHTGSAPAVDAATQRRFDEGHRIEALARPLAEKIIGEDLYPVVGSEGELSASFDGLTMDESTAFEHKTLNDELRAAMRDQGNGYGLPLQYQVQMEQQLMVSGADRVLFVASKWDGDNLVEELHCWYASDPQLRAKIVAGWAQFAQDLAAYVPPELIVPAVAAPQISLPALFIKVEGSIALVDNLPAVGAALTAFIEGLNLKPESDQDFANLEDAAKRLKAAEEMLDSAESGALSQTDSIDVMRRTVGLYRETARTNRLLVEKLVKAEKENRRTAIVSEAAAELSTHYLKLIERIGKPYLPMIAADFHGVIKGLKSLDSMKDKVSTELARAKIAANEVADRIQLNLSYAADHIENSQLPDIATLVLKAPDDFAAVVQQRLTAQVQREAEARERIRAEEQAKAEKEAREKVAAEQAAVAPVVKQSPAVVPFEAVVALMPATVRQAMAPRPSSAPTLTLGTISERLGFTVTSAFLSSLGYEATTVRASKLYHEEDFKPICQAIKTHVNEVSEQFDTVAA
jgi:putative phage-type endonuclease